MTSNQDASTVIAELIPGYEGMDTRGRRLARVAHAGRIHDELHRHFLDRIAQDDIPIASKDRRTLDSPYWLISTARQWDCVAPLVLIDIHYLPYGFNTAPLARDGMTVWLRPTDEKSYLHSLADLWSMLAGCRPNGGQLHRTVQLALGWLRQLALSAA
jgi:hypothetical protein